MAVRRCIVQKEQVDALGEFIGESKVRWDGLLRGLPRSLPVNGLPVGPDHVTTTGEGNENLEEVDTDGEEDYHDLVLVNGPNVISLPGPGESVVVEGNYA
jgi:hypothetical protein